MIKDFFTGQFNASMHLRIFKQAIVCCISLSLLSYVGIRIIFFDISFEWMEELLTMQKVLLTGGSFATGISTILLAADAIQYSIKKAKSFQPAFIVKSTAIAMLLLIIAIGVSNAQTSVAGILKDNATGITTIYKEIKPGKVMLVMNDEVLHHTDIPIGESFVLMNNSVKGLVVKSGKVSVGCSLLIKDKKGKVLMKADDLFKGKDIFDKGNADYLKCTVSTGEPMQWEQKYDVTVIFWDKYGTGKIENKVTIRCIDIP